MVRHDSLPGPGPTDLELEVPTPSRRRSTGAEWDRLVAIGFFGPDERLELIDGEVRVMSPIGDLHAVTVTKVTRSLDRAFGDGFFSWSQNPLAVGEDRLYPASSSTSCSAPPPSPGLRPRPDAGRRLDLLQRDDRGHLGDPAALGPVGLGEPLVARRRAVVAHLGNNRDPDRR